MIPVITSFTNAMLGGESFTDLPATKIETVYGPAYLSAWRPSDQEIKNLINGGAVFLLVLGAAHPPVILSAEPDDFQNIGA